MSVIVRPISANLTHDTEFLQRMDPYVKIYFGGQQFRTAVCRDGSKHPSWNDVFTFNPSGDSSMRIEVWDLDSVNDDLIGEGSYNLMKIYNMPSMRSDNEYIDLFYKGRGAGRILISFQLQGMTGYYNQSMGNQGTNYGNNNSWSQPMQPMNQGWNPQPPMNTGWGNQPQMNPMNPMNNNGWGNGPTNNNGWGNGPTNNNGWNNMPPPNNGWGF